MNLSIQIFYIKCLIKLNFFNFTINIKKWTKYVEPLETDVINQIDNLTKLGPSVIQGHITIMPDVHLGKGGTVGSVIPTKNAIIPATVGVYICWNVFSKNFFKIK